MSPISFETKNANLPRAHFKIRRNRERERELTGGPWRGTRPSSSPAFPAHGTTRSNPPTQTEIKTASRHRHIACIAENRTYREGTLPERDLGGGATGMDGRTEQTEPARAQERGTVRRGSASSPLPLSLRPRLKIPAMRWRPHLSTGKRTSIQRYIFILFYRENCTQLQVSACEAD
jgi:hypothetical protein